MRARRCGAGFLAGRAPARSGLGRLPRPHRMRPRRTLPHRPVAGRRPGPPARAARAAARCPPSAPRCAACRRPPAAPCPLSAAARAAAAAGSGGGAHLRGQRLGFHIPRTQQRPVLVGRRRAGACGRLGLGVRKRPRGGGRRERLGVRWALACARAERRRRRARPAGRARGRAGRRLCRLGRLGAPLLQHGHEDADLLVALAYLCARRCNG